MAASCRRCHQPGLDCQSVLLVHLPHGSSSSEALASESFFHEALAVDPELHHEHQLPAAPPCQLPAAAFNTVLGGASGLARWGTVGLIGRLGLFFV